MEIRSGPLSWIQIKYVGGVSVIDYSGVFASNYGGNYISEAFLLRVFLTRRWSNINLEYQHETDGAGFGSGLGLGKHQLKVVQTCTQTHARTQTGRKPRRDAGV